jgi:hypothetical protein
MSAISERWQRQNNIQTIPKAHEARLLLYYCGSSPRTFCQSLFEPFRLCGEDGKSHVSMMSISGSSRTSSLIVTGFFLQKGLPEKIGALFCSQLSHAGLLQNLMQE